MTLQDLQQQVVQLPVRDRWQLVQTLLASIQQDTEANLNPSPDPWPPNPSTKPLHGHRRSGGCHAFGH